MGSGKHPRTPKAPDPRETAPPPRKKNPKTSPGGCSGDPISQAAGARPHNNFETLGQGHGNLQRSPPQKKTVHSNGGAIALFLQSRFSRWPGPGFPRILRARPCPALPRRPNLARPNPARRRGRGGPASAPRGSAAPKHSPRPGCAPRGPAPSPINGML